MCKPYCKALSPSENIVVSESAPSCINGKAITGDVCLFDCSKLYHLSRKKVLTCTDSGNWDENIPSCKSLLVMRFLNKLFTWFVICDKVYFDIFINILNYSRNSLKTLIKNKSLINDFFKITS